jgi:hypothetical protein
VAAIKHVILWLVGAGDCNHQAGWQILIDRMSASGP